MSLIEENFALLADNLNENVAVQIQSALRLLDDNTDTQIKLSNPNSEAQTVDFELVTGSIDDVNQACEFKDVKINGQTLGI